jgi:hypothetical protein
MRVCFILIVTLVGSGLAPDGYRSQGDSQSQLALTLRGGTDGERQTALARVLAIPRDERTPEIIDAVVQEVGRVRSVYDDRRRRYGAGEELEPLPETDYLHRLLRVLSDVRDPSVVGPLCSFVELGTTALVGDALARFGDRALQCVATVAADRGARSSRLSGALHILTRMLSVADPPVSSLGRARMREIARDRLFGEIAGAAVSPIYRAAELALHLKDAALIDRVRELATIRTAVSGLGVRDEWRVALLQQRLRTLLSRSSISASRKSPARLPGMVLSEGSPLATRASLAGSSRAVSC